MVRAGAAHKIPVLSLVHRESGQCRSFVVDNVTRDTLLPIVLQNVQRETYIITNEAGQYRGQFRKLFLGHGVVNHSGGEYGRGPSSRRRARRSLAASHDGKTTVQTIKCLLMLGPRLKSKLPASSANTWRRDIGRSE